MSRSERRIERAKRRSLPARRRVSLGMRLTVSLLLVAAITGGLVGWLLVGQTAKGYRQGHQREALTLARAVAVDAGTNAGDPGAMEEFSDRLLIAVPSLHAVRVYVEGEGEPALWVSTLPNDTASSLSTRAGVAAGAAQRHLTLRGQEVLETIQPLELDGQRVGVVALYSSLQQLRADVRRQSLFLVALITVAAVSAVALFGLLLYGQVLSPLRRLSRAAARVAAGDVSPRLPAEVRESGRDTLSQLGAELDHMIHSVDTRTRQQAAVADLSRLIIEDADLDTLLAETTALLSKHLEVEFSSALELSADGTTLSFRSGTGWRRPLSTVTTPAGRGSQAGYTLEVGQPVIVDELAAEERFSSPAALLEHGVRSGLSVVVGSRERPWGVLAAYSATPARFDRDDALYLTALAGTLASAIDSRRAQERLERAEAKYRILVERVPAITYIADFGLDGRWSFVSPQVESMLGYTPQEWLEDPGLWGRSLHPDDRAAALEHEAVARETGQPLSSEYRLIARDGREVWVRDEAVLEPDEEGRHVLQGIMYDVTEQRLAELATEEVGTRYQALVEQVPAVVYMDAVDDASTALYISPHVEQLTGYTAAEWMTEKDLWMRSLHPDDADEILALSLSTNETGQPFRAEYRLGHRDGSYRWIRDEAVLVDRPDGAPYWQGIFYDITDRRDAEERLRRSFEQEREVGDRLRAIDEMKNAFLAAVSHELRTPLSSVLGYALTLERPDLDVSPQERQDMTHRLALNARKLERLLTDLLDLDRLARGVLEPNRRPTDMPALVQRVLEETELRGRGIDVVVEPLKAEIDAPKVERIVENLVVNAIKHTPSDARIRLVVERSPDGIEVRVEDEGPGVPDDMKALVFEPFRQGAGVPDLVPGTGIGLSLVARFAELHGGRAWVHDRQGGGSVFRVSLPCHATASDAQSASV